MELYLLGTGTLVPQPDRGPSGYALRGPEGLALVDGGSGTLGRLAGLGLDYREIADLLYTHRHPDHTADLVPFLFARKYGEAGVRRVRIRGPQGFPAFVRGLQEAWQGWATPDEDDIEVELSVVPEPGAPFTVAGVEVRAFPVEHSDPAVAYRFEDPTSGGTLCYSGDTELCEGIIEAADDVDVLVLECSMPDDRRASGHLTPETAARVIEESGARRTILVHLYPLQPLARYRTAVAKHLGRRVEIGTDGMSVEL